jgi:hypothetical protein
MSLKGLKSNLKNLKFGHDTPGGGSSGLPYIKPGLPEDSPAGEYLAGIARTSADFPLRGGTYSTIASTEDTIRISRFLNDFPKGPIFTSKQVGLQKSNPKIETGEMGGRLNTQTYNLNANLLAQVFEQGTGTHINRAGFNTNELTNSQNKYEYIVSHKSKDQNRLVNLFNVKVNSNLDDIVSSLDSATSLGITTNNDNTLFDYVGGPDSIFGDGNTTIFKSTDFKGVPIDTSLALKGQIRPEITSSINMGIGLSSGSYPIEDTQYQQGYGITAADFIRPNKTPEGVSPVNSFNNTMGYNALISSSLGVLQDFRKYTIDPNPLAEDYTDPYVPMITRIGIGSPGARKDRSNPYVPFIDGQDKINMSPIYRKGIGDRIEKDSDDVRDLIKFCIEVIDNNSPNVTDRMHFRAFLTNFSDNIGAEWDSKKYMGRGENFYTYQGFTREVGFTFIVAAQSVEEMEKIYQKTNYLASTLLPDYQAGTGFMRGNLHKLTIGEYFYRVPGIITSMNISVEDNYAWEIKMKQPELRKQNNDQGVNKDQLQMEVPQILKIQMSFKPIMDKLPQKGLKEPIIVSEAIAYNYLLRENFNFA